MGILKSIKNITAHFDSKGQGTLEYILLLVVVISIGVGLAGHFFVPFGEYIKGITSSELKCSLETGELLGSQRLRDEGCVPNYEVSTWDPQSSGGRSGQTDGASGSSSSSGSNSSSSSSSSGSNSSSGTSKKKSPSSNSSSSGGDSSSSDSSGSASGSDSSSSSSSSSSSGGDKSNSDDSSADEGGEGSDSSRAAGRGRARRVKRIIGRNGKLEMGAGGALGDSKNSGDNSITYEMGDDENDKFSGNRNRYNKNRNKPRAITGYGIVEEDEIKKKEDKKTASASTKSIKAGNESETKTKQLKINNSSGSKIKNEVEEGWSISKWIRIAVIVLIIAGILIFLFFQIVQITKGLEKN